ncbi:hypothetical protein EJD97_020528 [Solanum chilense]|uniref:AP2/ERF domain-containing protein n=1 Tax=Solanum chilense TaxID=4083 RepID=A0A6N2CCZ8_SOLCI|nr:hypothetical protein EJD97_020528 [Solanum chilense]
MAKKKNDDPTTTTMVVVAPNEVQYKGLRKRPWGGGGTYEAMIINPIQKVRVFLGIFKTSDEAARPFDKETRVYDIAKTKLNFPSTNEANLKNSNNLET